MKNKISNKAPKFAPFAALIPRDGVKCTESRAMDKYLYFKSASFESNKELATWFLAELNARRVDS
jgi:hypothetical protein